MKDHVTRHDLERFTGHASDFARRHTATNVADTHQRLKDWTPGIRAAASDGGRGSHGPGDPTGEHAAAPPDLSVTMLRQWAHAWQRLDDAIALIDRITTWANTHADPLDRTTNASRIPICANPHCRDDIVLPHGATPVRGRCEPCAVYLERHDRDAGPKVIADRRRWRDQQAQRLAASPQVNA